MDYVLGVQPHRLFLQASTTEDLARAIRVFWGPRSPYQRKLDYRHWQAWLALAATIERTGLFVWADRSTGPYEPEAT